MVIDDGSTYRGREEIVGWLTGQASEFTTTSTRLSADRTDRTVVVVTRVEGNFPGGRIDLRNVFTLDGAGPSHHTDHHRVAGCHDDAVREGRAETADVAGGAGVR